MLEWPDHMFSSIALRFLEFGVDKAGFNQMFVHRTLLVFLCDFLCDCGLGHDVVEYHTPMIQNRTVQDPRVQNPMNRTGWAHMVVRDRLLVVLIHVYDQHTYLSSHPYYVELDRLLVQFYQSLGRKEWFRCCDVLRKVIFDKHHNYMYLFRHIDWDVIQAELQAALGP